MDKTESLISKKHLYLVQIFIVAFVLAAPPLIFAASDKNPTKLEKYSVHKKQFYALMYPIVMEENQKILKLRARIQSAAKNNDIAIIRKILLEYKLSPADSVDRLLKRVDIIPPELVLAQSALETNWGRSRFSKEGNNMFGQWCHSKGCGMVPKDRTPGLAHEVAVYPSINASVKSYLKNINTHSAYAIFREIRQRLRKNDQTLDALLLAEGLGKYSKKGTAYIKSIQQMIRANEYLLADISP